MPSQRGEPFSAQGCVYLQHDDCWRPLGGTESKSTMSLLRLSVSRMRLSALTPRRREHPRCPKPRPCVPKHEDDGEQVHLFSPPRGVPRRRDAVRLTVTPLCAVAQGCW